MRGTKNSENQLKRESEGEIALALCSFSSLPDELKVMIFSFLYTQADLFWARAVSREWRKLVPKSRLFETPEDKVYSELIVKLTPGSRAELISASSKLLSPDGEHIMCKSDIGEIKIMKVRGETWEKKFPLDIKENLVKDSCVGFSADGKYILVCTSKGFIEIRNLSNKEKKHELQLQLSDKQRINNIAYHAGKE
jgi:WD40 repeat protein